VNVHLIDGTYELFRAYYGGPKAENAEGREVGAVQTFARSMLSLLRDPTVTHVGCAFDTVIRSFRNELFHGYKTEEGIEPALFSQFPLVEQASRALGLVTWSMIDFEADDAMATMAGVAAKDSRVERIFLCSPDKDLAQCVEGNRVVCLDRMRKITLDDAGVIEKFGVPPASIPEYLALVGDTADGIPGIKGFGAKSASAILAAYGTIDAIPRDPEAWSVKLRGAPRLAAALNAERDEAALYRKLATLRFDVPLGTSVNDLEWRGAAREELDLLVTELGDEGLRERVAQVSAERLPSL
jgi:5'-3' exonuclease